MRKLVKTLLSLSLMAPVAALALGLGDVQLHSDLNQRLNADIKLLSVNPAEADSIQVSLASAEDFAKVGLDRPGTLMFLRFDLQQKPNGEYYIKLTSKDAIREPFLDFLVEVKWRSGRVLREYTILLDPPVSYRDTAPAISAPVTEAAPAITQTAVEDEFVPPPSAIPVAPGVKAPAPAPAESGVAEKAEETESAMAEALAAPAPKAAQPSGAIVYGPVKANETLWRIAQKIRPSNDVSAQQMMMALLKANPYAFFDNNINRLKKGYVLRIDDPALIAAMSKAEAAREVSRQTRQWQDTRTAKAEKAAKRPLAEADKAEAPSGAVAAAKKEPKLELVAPNGKSEKPGEGAEDVDSLKKEMMLALESSAAQRKENETLQKRINGLEEQLEDMQRLLSLKDADLASLQQQLREQGQSLTLPSEKAEAPVAAAPETVEPTTAEAGMEEPAPAGDEAAEVSEPVAPLAPEAAPGEEPMQAVETEPTAAVTEAATEAKPPVAEEKPEAKPQVKPAEEKPVVKKPVPPRQPVVTQEPGIVDILMENLNFILMGLGGIFVLVLVSILIKRRRSGGFQESILSGGTSSMLNAAEDDLGSETSFLSDLAISGMGGGSIQSDEDEVDPLTEADVFMAYGRNQQAEEVLTKALEKNPGRQDLTVKLLEVYYNLKDNGKFLALAAGAAAALRADEDVWAKVAAMGHELDPENVVFEGAETLAQATGTPTAAAEAVSDDVLDIGLDIDELTNEMESEGAGEELDLDLGLDFSDLDESEEPAASAVAEAEETMDFDLGLGEAEEVSEEATADEEIGLDFDLNLGGEEETPAAEDSSVLDFDLGVLGMEEEESAAEDEGLDLGSLGSDEEALSMDFDLGIAEEETPESSSDELDLGELGDIDFGDLGLDASDELTVAEPEEDTLDLSGLESSVGGLDDFGDLGDLDDDGLLSDSDEIATKLDLAQAYIEMGDNEGARSMLEEVVDAGNDEQKQQAQELLSKI